MFDVKVAVDSLYSAANMLGGRDDGHVVLRPSRIGYCPLRLWKLQQDGVQEDPNIRRSWAPLQGNYNEALVRLLLRTAGAQVVDPPQDDSDLSYQEPDPVLGVYPHVDGLVYWPAVGITDWAILELKYMRASMQLRLAMNGLFTERDYAFQSVSYLGTAQQVMRNFAHSTKAPPQWADLYHMGVVPRRTLFFSVAKDPSMTGMLYSQQSRPAKYEDPDNRVLKGRKLKDGTIKGGGIKELTPEQLESMAKRERWRARFADIGEQTAFYLESFTIDDPEVQAIWQQVVEVPELVRAPEPPLPIHDPMLPLENLHEECAFYCESHEWCKDLTLSRNILGSIEQLRAEGENVDWSQFELAPAVEPGAEPPGER